MNDFWKDFFCGFAACFIFISGLAFVLPEKSARVNDDGRSCVWKERVYIMIPLISDDK